MWKYMRLILNIVQNGCIVSYCPNNSSEIRYGYDYDKFILSRTNYKQKHKPVAIRRLKEKWTMGIHVRKWNKAYKTQIDGLCLSMLSGC